MDLTSLLDDSSWSTGGNTYFGMGRPVNGEERASAWDYEAAVQFAYKRNGPVFALMLVRMQVFSEARFQFRQMSGGRPGALFGNQDLAVLETPWTNGTTGDLLSRMIQDSDLAGNAFVTDYNPGRLRRLRPDWVIIVTGSQEEPHLAGDAIDGNLVGYGYAPRGNWDDPVFLLPEQVAHFAPIPDPDFHYRGMSWLTPVVREITADSAATRHKLKFFEQGGTPQLVVSMDASVTPAQFAKFRATMDAATAGVDNAYRTLYLAGGADVTVAGKDLHQLDFKVTQGAGESRLAAAAGVPPSIVGFSEGLAGSSLNAGNYTATRRRFADATMRPLWRNVAGSLATLVNVPTGADLWYDERDVAFLREDSRDAAEIQGLKSRTIRQLTDAGFEPVSVIAAVEGDDFSLLRHTGLYSVQLQKPGGGPPAPALPEGP
jgi:phage portal protein BeeE